jgi:hypothetical protein
MSQRQSRTEIGYSVLVRDIILRVVCRHRYFEPGKKTRVGNATGSRYAMTVVLNIDSSETHARRYIKNIAGQTVCFAVTFKVIPIKARVA